MLEFAFSQHEHPQQLEMRGPMNLKDAPGSF